MSRLIRKSSEENAKISISLIEITEVHELDILEKFLKKRPDLKDTDLKNLALWMGDPLQSYKHLTCQHSFKKRKVSKVVFISLSVNRLFLFFFSMSIIVLLSFFLCFTKILEMLGKYEHRISYLKLF